MKYYESELFLYYMKMVCQQSEGKENSSIDLKLFLSYCSKNIVSVPSHMRFHHSNPLLLPLADSSSDCSPRNEEDTIIGIFELTRPSPCPPSPSAAVTTVGLSPGKKPLLEQRQHRLLSSSSPDQKSSSEYVLKKSFLAFLKEVTSHNEDLTEIRKISSIYMIPELKELYSSCMEATAAAGHDDEKEIVMEEFLIRRETNRIN
jgi:hypothetical protein